MCAWQRDFTEDELRESAGDRSFERGAGYLDAVSGLTVEPGADRATVRAVVHGGAPYRVWLSVASRGALVGRCSCPYGAEGNFCKHCVAVGLTVLADGGLIEHVGMQRTRDGSVDAWLDALSPRELLALVREQAAIDPGLRKRLELRAIATEGDSGSLRREMARMLDPTPFTRYGYMEYADVHAFADQARGAVPVLSDLVARGRAVDAVDLAREAVSRVEALYEDADDSSGVLGDLVADLLDLHLCACEAAAPDPTEIAEWLVGHMLGDYASDAVRLRDYCAVLGPSGLAAVHDLAAEALRRNPGGWAEQDLLGALLVLCAQGGIEPMAAGHADPADAVAAYVRLVDTYKVLTGDAAYEAIVRLLDKARACHEVLGTSEDFADYVRELRTQQRRKRKLLRLLDTHGM